MGSGLLGLIQQIQGNSPGQQRQQQQDRFSSFVDNDLPSIVEGIHKASSVEELQQRASDFFIKGLKAGMKPEALEKLSDRLIKPALGNLAAGEYDKLGSSLRGSDQPVQLGGPGFDESRGAVDSAPARSFGQGDAAALGGIEARTGFKAPAGLAGLLQAPSVVDENVAQAKAANQLASKHAVDAAIGELQRSSLENLPDGAVDDSGMSMRDLGQSTKGAGLAGLLGERSREKAAAPKQAAEIGSLNASRDRTNANIGNDNARTRSAVARDSAAADYSRAGIPLRNAQTDKTNAATGVGPNGELTTETDRVVSPDDQFTAEELIKRTAVKRGVNKLPPAEQTAALQEIAADFGFDLEGNPTLGTEGGFLGMGGSDALTGNFTLRARAKKTVKTKGKPGAGPEQSEGSPVARAQPKPGGAKTLDKALAQKFLEQAGGDKDKARQLAKAAGYSF